MNDDLISREALKKAVENLVAGGEERLKDYYENGSKSEENEWIGGVYDAWELIGNAPTVDTTCPNCDSGYAQGYSDGYLKGKEERPQGDLINRSALKAVISEYIDEYSDLDNQGYHCEKWCAMKEAEMAIDNAPTVEDRPTGKWIYRNYNWWCSECGEQPKTMGYVGTAKFMQNEFKFCNHCGAKMIGGVIYEGVENE